MSTDSHHSEVLRVPLRWWAVATMFLASMLLAFLVALPLGLAYTLTAVLVVATVGVFVGYGRARVAVGDGVLVAGRARVPLQFVADAEALDATQTRLSAGQQADARAYLLLRPYIPTAVRVQITDPADPAPYWLISTRRPRALVAALGAAADVSAPGRRAD